MTILFLYLAVILLGLALICFAVTLRCQKTLIDNAHAKIMRLEQVEDQRHGYDQAMDKKDVLRLRCKPDPNCRKCKGRGHIGKNTKTNRYVVCTCCG